MAIADYSTTAGSNTTISGINIAEGCPPGNMNDAIRQVMADIATARDDGSMIPDAIVEEAKLADSAVTEAKIADSAVTTDKIADDAVTVDKILDATITPAKLEDSGVTADEYGSSEKLLTLTVNAKGQITAISENDLPSFSQKVVTCDTAAEAAAKEITISSYVPAAGDVMYVTFTNGNTADVPTIYLNEISYPIKDEAGNTPSTSFRALFPSSCSIECVFDGTNWIYKNRVVKSYASGYAWYRVYANGWKEQGGYTGYSSNPQGVTLHLAHINTNYQISLEAVHSGGMGVSPLVYSGSVLTSGFSIYTGDTSINTYWKTAGF